MKVVPMEERKFNPVSIILETKEELEELLYVIKKLEEYGDNTGLLDDIKDALARHV